MSGDLRMPRRLVLPEVGWRHLGHGRLLCEAPDEYIREAKRRHDELQRRMQNRFRSGHAWIGQLGEQMASVLLTHWRIEHVWHESSTGSIDISVGVPTMFRVDVKTCWGNGEYVAVPRYMLTEARAPVIMFAAFESPNRVLMIGMLRTGAVAHVGWPVRKGVRMKSGKLAVVDSYEVPDKGVPPLVPQLRAVRVALERRAEPAAVN